MDKKKGPSPLSIVWQWAKEEHKEFYAAIVLAVIGVAGTMTAYFGMAALIRLLLAGGGFSEGVRYLGVILAGYVIKAICSAASTSISHGATYKTLLGVRKRMLAKLSRVPLGTIQDTPSGEYKTTIVDRVEGMEPTLAHLLPEMTANILAPLAVAVYIFVLDWRMGIASILTTVIGLVAASQSGKNYGVRWEGAVAVGRRMANAIVEYIGGIQVVKAFSQSAGSYKKYSGAVKENAGYYVDWMKENQRYMAVFQMVVPSVLLAVLPVGTLLWSGGSLDAATFLTVIVLSLGLTGPFLAAMSFVDELAVVGTNVGEINAILEAPELNRPEKEAVLNGQEICLSGVSFSYGKSEERVLRMWILRSIRHPSPHLSVGPVPENPRSPN